MPAFWVLMRKELLESWRTYRLPVVAGLFLLVGLSSPLLARFLPEIITAATGDSLPPIQLPPPTAADAVDQVQKNLGQFGALTAILLAMGAIAGELERGTAAFILSRPVRRGTFVATKALSIGLVLFLATVVAVAVGWVYTAILFEPAAVGGWVGLALLTWLALAAWAAVTFLASAITGSAIGAGGLGFVALLVLSIAAVVPAIARLTPAGLTEPALALATGRGTVASLGLDLWLPVASTLILIAACVVGAWAALRRREV